jgi:hypothetical protein
MLVVSRIPGPRREPVSQPTSAPKVLLLHDGELADVAALASELGAAVTERLAGALATDGETSWRLVIATARRALELPTPLLRASAFRIAVLDGRSRTVSALLRRASFELVVRRPVHPAALRLLLLHTLYRGSEKRRTPRVSVGAPVHFRSGLRRHRAILAEISERGCRLLSSQRVALGQSLTLQIPAAVAGGRAFSVKCLVVRATPAQIGASGELTLEFDPVSPSLRVRLRAVVSAYTAGPSALPGEEAPAQAARASRSAAEPGAARPKRAAAAPDPTEAAGAEGGRPAEEPPEPDSEDPPPPPRRLVPLSDEASRIVLAHRLSRQGMQADPSPRLARSREVTLSLHLGTDGPPLRVRADVEPGEADAGPWLRFKDLAPAESERLDRLLTGLWVLAGSRGPEHSLVVCEILDSGHG